MDARKPSPKKPALSAGRISLLSGLAAGIGTTMLVPETTHAFESARFAISELCQHMQGSLGALLFVAAGIGSIVSAALGNVKASSSLFFTGIGAATIAAMLSFYFPEAGDVCKNGTGGAAAGGDAGGAGGQGDGTPFRAAPQAREARQAPQANLTSPETPINPAVLSVLRGEPVELPEARDVQPKKEAEAESPEELDTFVDEF